MYGAGTRCLIALAAVAVVGTSTPTDAEMSRPAVPDGTYVPSTPTKPTYRRTSAPPRDDRAVSVRSAPRHRRVQRGRKGGGHVPRRSPVSGDARLRGARAEPVRRAGRLLSVAGQRDRTHRPGRRHDHVHEHAVRARRRPLRATRRPVAPADAA